MAGRRSTNEPKFRLIKQCRRKGCFVGMNFEKIGFSDNSQLLVAGSIPAGVANIIERHSDNRNFVFDTGEYRL